MLETVVDETKLFSQQYIATHKLGPKSRVHRWNNTPHTLAELKKFLALIITMGLVDYPRIEDAWVTTWPFASYTFSSVMSRNRFSLIMKFLHLNDSTHYIPKDQPGFDALYKLRPFHDPLLRNIKEAYVLRRELAVDESMIGFKGRLSFIQYLPKKPTKWGMKAFMLADSVSGYTYAWRLYTGVCMCVCVCVCA